mmetsp:Transcript_38968/g.76181  ORF Transcript_38968/g.76181 Transcript_38968/m.76181 type:complete len:82 (+) Transcript_38968:177-422(+)
MLRRLTASKERPKSQEGHIAHHSKRKSGYARGDHVRTKAARGERAGRHLNGSFRTGGVARSCVSSLSEQYPLFGLPAQPTV